MKFLRCGLGIRVHSATQKPSLYEFGFSVFGFRARAQSSSLQGINPQHSGIVGLQESR